MFHVMDSIVNENDQPSSNTDASTQNLEGSQMIQVTVEHRLKSNLNKDLFKVFKHTFWTIICLVTVMAMTEKSNINRDQKSSTLQTIARGLANEPHV